MRSASFQQEKTVDTMRSSFCVQAWFLCAMPWCNISAQSRARASSCNVGEHSKVLKASRFRWQATLVIRVCVRSPGLFCDYCEGRRQRFMLLEQVGLPGEASRVQSTGVSG